MILILIDTSPIRHKVIYHSIHIQSIICLKAVGETLCALNKAIPKHPVAIPLEITSPFEIAAITVPTRPLCENACDILTRGGRYFLNRW